MALVSEVLKHIGRIYSPLNLASINIQKHKFVWNTAPDNQRVLNFMRNPYCRIFLLSTCGRYRRVYVYNDLQISLSESSLWLGLAALPPLAKSSRAASQSLYDESFNIVGPKLWNILQALVKNIVNERQLPVRLGLGGPLWITKGTQQK